LCRELRNRKQGVAERFTRICVGALEDGFVTCQLAVGEKSSPGQPDQRIAPLDGDGDRGDASPENICPANVLHLVQQDEVQL